MTKAMEPPPFEAIAADTVLSGNLPALPTYTDATTTKQTEHRYTLFDGTRPWLTLVLHSKARRPTDNPYFFGNAPITGRVELDLVKPEYCLGLTLVVEGHMRRCVKVADAGFFELGLKCRADRFMQERHEIWKSDAHSTTFVKYLRQREGSSLVGQLTFDFSFRLPHFCAQGSVSCSRGSEVPLPPSFLNTGSSVWIKYGLCVAVQRGSLSMNDRVNTPFLWQPVIQPPIMSIARKLAYSYGIAAVPDVIQDPGGWIALDNARVHGCIFGQRYIEAKFQLSLAKPLSYTRGSVIPLNLMIECVDEQGLALFSDPAAVSVKLILNKLFDMGNAPKRGPIRRVQRELFLIQHAQWCTTPVLNDDLPPFTRQLMGEIHIKPSLQAAFQLLDCDLFYSVTLFAPDAPEFVLSPELAQGRNPKRIALRGQEVGIATVYSEDCVRPLPVTRASYDKVEQWSSADVVGKEDFDALFVRL